MQDANTSTNDYKLSEDTIAHIASAYAQRPDVSIDDIVNLTSRLAASLCASGTNVTSVEMSASETFTPAAQEKIKPAVPISEAVTDGKVFCLCCGSGFKTLKRHLKSAHGLDETAYRKMFDLNDDFPIVAPDYSERRARVATESGFGKYDRTGQIPSNQEQV